MGRWLLRCNAPRRGPCCTAGGAAHRTAPLRADSCPAVFNVHVRQFVDLIWSGLRDPKLELRSAAVAALRACLQLVAVRETRYRVQWWYDLFEQTMRGLVRPWLKASERDIEANVHASLLTLGELLQHSSEFMLARCGHAALHVTLRFAPCNFQTKHRGCARMAVISHNLQHTLLGNMRCAACLRQQLP